MPVLPHLRPVMLAGCAVTALGLLAGCALESPPEDAASTGSKRVVVATHDSWSMSEKVMREFTETTGYEVVVQRSGDAGALTNKLVLTEDSPIADLAYGIDNTFASRAVEAGVLAAYSPEGDVGADFEPQDQTVAERVTPVDYSDVCVNVDQAWFDEQGVRPPETFEDLLEPAYEGLFVTPGPPTSSPGLAFLVATVARFGEGGWQDYWQALLDDNGAKVTSGWSDAYQVDFTAGGGGGDRPIVLSYASSPPFTIPEGGEEPTTRALLDTCFRQVEYAAVLEGADNPEGAQALVDFMLGRSFQEALPDQMYVFPVNDEVELPELWARFAVSGGGPLDGAGE